MNTGTILLIEDDTFKERNVTLLLNEEFPHFRVHTARSVNSAVRYIGAETPPQLIVLDMSLPTYDVSATESGGRPQGFGGQTVLHHIEASDYVIPTIVLTQFEWFGEDDSRLDLSGLELLLEQIFPDIFNALIFYSSSGTSWKSKLINAISEIVRENG